MPSLNSSLNMGQRALSMNQRAMHTSGHNIANQQTEGFSRQQVTTQSAPADPLGLGRGAEAQPTTRVFDHFVQKKILQEIPRTGVFHTREDYLNKIEMLLNELEGNGPTVWKTDHCLRCTRQRDPATYRYQWLD